jgi:hypothetical protein
MDVSFLSSYGGNSQGEIGINLKRRPQGALKSPRSPHPENFWKHHPLIEYSGRLKMIQGFLIGKEGRSLIKG